VIFPAPLWTLGPSQGLILAQSPHFPPRPSSRWPTSPARSPRAPALFLLASSFSLSISWTDPSTISHLFLPCAPQSFSVVTQTPSFFPRKIAPSEKGLDYTFTTFATVSFFLFLFLRAVTAPFFLPFARLFDRGSLREEFRSRSLSRDIFLLGVPTFAPNSQRDDLLLILALLRLSPFRCGLRHGSRYVAPCVDPHAPLRNSRPAGFSPKVPPHSIAF